MLVLTRKKSEKIVIADDIEVTVIRIDGDKVRIGVEAPKHVPVHRHEVHEAIQRAKASEVTTEATEGTEDHQP